MHPFAEPLNLPASTVKKYAGEVWTILATLSGEVVTCHTHAHYYTLESTPVHLSLLSGQSD
jgi:hypothetical protein